MTQVLTLGCALCVLAAAFGFSQAQAERVAFVGADSALFTAAPAR